MENQNSNSATEQPTELENQTNQPQAQQNASTQSKKSLKKQKQFGQSLTKQFMKQAKEAERRRNYEDQLVANAMSFLTKEEARQLEEICTVNIPEQKNEAGEVTALSQSYVDWGVFVKEANFIKVLKRQERINSGLRKSSSGRSSKRKSHKSTLAYVISRNNLLAPKSQPEGTVTNESSQVTTNDQPV